MLAARFRGWPHKPAWFSLGRWGKLVNILAILYGGLMLLNIAHLADPSSSATSAARAGRSRTRPSTRSSSRSATSRGHAGLADLRDARRARSWSLGAIYYVVAIRGRAADVEADAVTGEATIG